MIHLQDELAIVNLLLLVYAVGLIYLKANEVIRRWWVQPHLAEKERRIKGAYEQTFRYFKLNNHEEFYHFTRMSVSLFDLLFKLVETHLTKPNKKCIRKRLPGELKLAAFLNYAAVGGNIRHQAWFFRIGRSTMYKVVHEVSRAILKSLRENYLQFPNKEQWEVIANNFQHEWQVPNCLGALDGKHVRLKSPPNSGSLFFNYKKFFSIVLMAACDAYGRFTWLNCGHFGHLNDANIFNDSDLGMGLAQRKLDLPEPQGLSNAPDQKIPFFFLGDGIFGLKSYLMTPYARSSKLTYYEKIYNYRHARARRVIECAFGTLVSKWQILQKPMNFKLRRNDEIVMALACVHNFLITSELKTGENNYCDLEHPPPRGLFYDQAEDEISEQDCENIEDNVDLDFVNEFNDDDSRETEEEIFENDDNLEEGFSDGDLIHGNSPQNFDDFMNKDCGIREDTAFLINFTGDEISDDCRMAEPDDVDFFNNGLLNTEYTNQDLSNFATESVEHEVEMEAPLQNSGEHHDTNAAALNNNLFNHNWADVVLDNDDIFVENFARENHEEIIEFEMQENPENLGNFNAIVVRERLTRYFIPKEGSLSYQWNQI